jgi:hypothetical protein
MGDSRALLTALFFAVTVVTAVAGLAGIISGFGFRKGIPLVWRVACVVLSGLWIGFFCGLLARSEDHYGFGVYIGAGLIVALSFTGLSTIWAAVIHVTRSIMNRVARRRESH